jgi:hypothetical protein
MLRSQRPCIGVVFSKRSRWAVLSLIFFLLHKALPTLDITELEPSHSLIHFFSYPFPLLRALATLYALRGFPCPALTAKGVVALPWNPPPAQTRRWTRKGLSSKGSRLHAACQRYATLRDQTPLRIYGNYTFLGAFGFAKTSLEDCIMRAFIEPLKPNKLQFIMPLIFRIWYHFLSISPYEI